MRWLGIVAAAAAAAGCYDSRFGQPGAEQAPWTPTEHIAALRERYAGETFEVTGDIVVEGVVTSDDTRGNFYRSLCIEEQSAAIEIMTGTDHLHNDYPRGCRVVLRLRQLAVGESRGVLQAGQMPAPGSGYATDYIGSQAALDRATEPRPREEQPVRHTIAYLKSLCDGAESRLVTREITVRGFITANDRYGEFYKSIVLEDETGGITVAVDQTGTAAEFPFGYVATLHGAGLRLCVYGGKVGIGIGAGEQGAEGIPAEETDRYLTVEPPGEERHTARTVTIDGIGPGLVDTRVRIDGVRFVESGATWCDTDPETGRTVTTERTIVDEQGNTLAVRTLGSCSYAKEPLPEGRGSLYGVVDCFSGKYSLRVTNRDLLFP